MGHVSRALLLLLTALIISSPARVSANCRVLLSEKYIYIPIESDVIIHTERSAQEQVVEVSRTTQSFRIIQSGIHHDGLVAYKVLNEWKELGLLSGSDHHLMTTEGGYLLVAKRVRGSHAYQGWEPLMAAPVDGVMFTDRNGQTFKWTKHETFEVPGRDGKSPVVVHDVFQRTLISTQPLGPKGHSFTLYAKGWGPIYAEVSLPQDETVTRTWYLPRSEP